MGCLGSKSSEASEESSVAQTEPKVYSWDKRKNEDKEKYFVRNKHGLENSVFRNDVENIPISVENCSNCLIFLLGVTKTVTIDSCENVKIICFSADSVYARDSSDVSVVSACGQFRCRDCRRLDLFLHCATQPVIESSQKIQTAPLIIDFESIENHLQNLNISKFTNHWNQIHDFGPLGNESNWCLAKSVTGKLDEIYDSFGNMFMTAPIVRSTHSHFPVIDCSESITKKEASFVIFSGQDAENLATSCYQGLTQDKKIGALVKSACRKSTNVALPERAQKSLIREESSVLIGLFFRGTISAIDYSAYAQPGQSYLSFNQEAENDADLFFSNLSTFD